MHADYPGSWGIAYNLYADKLLGTNVFPSSVYDMRTYPVLSAWLNGPDSAFAETKWYAQNDSEYRNAAIHHSLLTPRSCIWRAA